MERILVAAIDAVLDEAGLTNEAVRSYVKHWAQHTGAERVEVVNASDDARLIREALEAGELMPAGEGRYYSRSHPKDTARSEERTVVATNDPADAGAYNNWKPASEMRPLLEDRMRGASAGKTMYVVPYLMAPHGSPLEPYAVGVELTDSRPVVLHMIRMARVHVDYVNGLADPNNWTNHLYTYDIGFNWYWTQFVKLSFDWQHAQFNQSVLVRPGGRVSSIDQVLFRFQIYF